MKESDVVGILIVVHNRREDLLKLLHSLYDQEYCAFEVLIVDNGSTDDFSDLKLLDLELLRLEKNLGFVSGMVAGIKYLLKKRRYRYIWILDSDVVVSASGLARLVSVSNHNDDIGVAGCVIYNVNDREIVVEAGADVNLKSGVVTAKHCNERAPVMQSVIDVDFIASGGAASLINVSALYRTGFHDERYFFLWEDTDFGLNIKKNNLRSVIVRDAIVWHPPFTEKRNPNIYFYYGVRNPLLTVAKYSSVFALPWYLYGNLRRYVRISMLMFLSGRSDFARLSALGIYDYCVGRFGKREIPLFERGSEKKEEITLSSENRIVILGTGSHDIVTRTVSAVKNASTGKVYLVVQSYRVSFFEHLGVDEIITYDDRSTRGAIEYIKIALTIIRKKACIVNSSMTVTSPLSYLALRVYDWDGDSETFCRSGVNIFSVWKPIVSFLIGDLAAVLATPPVWVASLRHRKRKPEFPK